MPQANPFKFGSIVEEPYFTDRIAEQADIRLVLQSETHLIIISPRRYGKTSLVKKVVATLGRPLIFLDLQFIIDVSDLASQILKRVYRVYPFERLKGLLKNFKISPTIHLNPQSNEVEVSFLQTSNQLPLLEDVFNLLDSLGTEKKKPIVVLDEFQDINRLQPNLDRQLRAIVQHHQHINYVFMGSVESMMRDIFEKKKSPFYHFGQLMPLDKIPFGDFSDFISKGFRNKNADQNEIAARILDITQCHLYYTQQLAYTVWNSWDDHMSVAYLIQKAVDALVQTHDMDYQRLWQGQNQTDKKILLGIASGLENLLAQEAMKKIGLSASSTLFSRLKRLVAQGYILKENSIYVIDDPFFKNWILKKRNQ